jgi:hypothetical protein
MQDELFNCSWHGFCLGPTPFSASGCELCGIIVVCLFLRALMLSSFPSLSRRLVSYSCENLRKLVASAALPRTGVIEPCATRDFERRACLRKGSRLCARNCTRVLEQTPTQTTCHQRASCRAPSHEAYESHEHRGQHLSAHGRDEDTTTSVQLRSLLMEPNKRRSMLNHMSFILGPNLLVFS